MKKFVRAKTYREIKRQCKEQDVMLDDHLYRTKHWDTIVVGDQRYDSSGHVVFNTFNGRFYGQAPWPQYSSDGKPIRFTSDSTRFENEPWFQALLRFFYVEK